MKQLGRKRSLQIYSLTLYNRKDVTILTKEKILEGIKEKKKKEMKYININYNDRIGRQKIKRFRFFSFVDWFLQEMGKLRHARVSNPTYVK